MNLKPYVPCHLILQTYVIVNKSYIRTIEISVTLLHYS